MKTSLNLSCTTRKFGDKKAIELHKKAGFEAFDFSCQAYVDYDWQKESVKLLDGHPILSKDGVFVSNIKGYTRGDIIVAKRNDEEEQKYVVETVVKCLNQTKVTA